MIKGPKNTTFPGEPTHYRIASYHPAGAADWKWLLTWSAERFRFESLFGKRSGFIRFAWLQLCWGPTCYEGERRSDWAIAFTRIQEMNKEGAR